MMPEVWGPPEESIRRYKDLVQRKPMYGITSKKMSEWVWEMQTLAREAEGSRQILAGLLDEALDLIEAHIVRGEDSSNVDWAYYLRSNREAVME